VRFEGHAAIIDGCFDAYKDLAYPESDATNLVSPEQKSLPYDALDLAPGEVHARMREARERGQPFYPWPTLLPEEWRASLAAIQSALTQLLARDGFGEARSAPFVFLKAPAGARALGVAAFTSGTGPLLGFCVESGTLASEPEVARLLLLHLAHGRRRAERLRTELVRVVGLLADRGVTPTVIKGFHTAHEFFPDPGARPISDLDLVVARSDVERASRALRDAGFTSKQVLERPYTCEWTAPGVEPTPRSLELTHEANAWTIDLHDSFERDFGGVRIVSVVPPGVEATEPWEVSGCALRVLAQPYLLAYVAAHASQELKNLTLVRLVELALIMRRGVQDGSLRWDELLMLLERQRAAPFLHPALELTARLAPATVPPDVLAAVERAAPPRVRRIVDRLEPSTAQRLEGVSLDESFMWAVGPLEHLRRIRRALRPTWAGSWRDQIKVLAARARQLLTGRVTVRDASRRGKGR
jgi:hypothetical protein